MHIHEVRKMERLPGRTPEAMFSADSRAAKTEKKSYVLMMQLLQLSVSSS